VAEKDAPSVTSAVARPFRDALGRFATGITIVTTRGAAGELVGFTASSFNSVSLEPPLVLFSLGRASSSWDAFIHADLFGVNVLRESQQDLSTRFAKTATDKFEGVPYELGATGVPLLKGVLAHFECRVRHRYDGGDHVIFVGEVLHFEHDEGDPLIYFGSRYRGLR
jgi:3-hydroxy-9,10-secoandrosta-1,3,5(10)-triene-9,17-dione monooxygenase reductase component